MEGRRRTIGLPPSDQGILDDIEDADVFNDRKAAARFAMALGIKNHEGPPDKLEERETIWNVGSFDPEGEIRELIAALFPDTETPYRNVEYFIHEGLAAMEEHVSAGFVDLEPLLLEEGGLKIELA